MATADITTTTQTTTSQKTGIDLSVQTQTNTQTIGNFVTDVSIQPYIATRIVSFYAYGLRPNIRVHIFFDSQLVDQYCAPGLVPQSINNTSDYNSITKNGNWGDAITTDLFGQVAGQFNIPAATFKTGDRVLEIADVPSIAQGSDAISTSASATFTASNLSVTKQIVTLTTVNPEISTIPVTQTVTSTPVTSVSNIVIHPDIQVVTGTWTEPIAQGLTINTPNGEAGIFATSIDIYFKQKSQTQKNGVTVYLCETTNGYPDGSKVLPFSTVHLPWANVTINSSGSPDTTFAGPATSDGTQFPTTFTFESPVFLNNGKEYAFVVKPDAGDPDYWVYSANLGDQDLVTSTQVIQQPVLGTAFYGATDGEWTALQTEYIKFNLRRASFSNYYGNAVFRNTNTDFLSVYNMSYACTAYGILPGDYVFQSTTAVPATACTSIKGIVNYYDTVNGTLYVANSSGTFTNNAFVQIHRFANATLAVSPNTTTLVASANTANNRNIIMDAFVPQFATISPAGTTLSFNIKGVSNSYITDTNFIGVTPGIETEFYDKERLILSRSNEVAVNSGTKSLALKADMTTTSEYLSPVIDTVKKQELVIGNSIDPISFIYNEFYNSGSSKSKYVSKIVTLAAGQDAQDMQIIMDAYRPPGSDIQLWVKFLNGYDTDPISQKTWTPMINTGAGLLCDPNNPNDVREYTYTIPQYYVPISTNGSITVLSACSVVTGTGTQFGVSGDIQVGMWINMLSTATFTEQSRQVISIASTTSLTLSSPFTYTSGYTSAPTFIVAPPTTPWLSKTSNTALAGTVNSYTTNNTIVGTGTSFQTLGPGQYISVNGDKQKIVSISNSTYLNVGTVWSSNAVANTAYIISPNGLSYLNNGLSQFSQFKQFQIKAILQSNDTSKVPLMKNIRALAMQL